MTTATSLIQSAYREGNLIAVSKSPSIDEQTEALERLNRLVKGVYGFEVGENLRDWLAPSPQRTAPIAANYPQFPWPDDLTSTVSSNIWPYPPRNRRIVWGGVTATIYFPENPMDGSRMAVVQGSGAGDSGAPGATLTLDGNGRTIEGANTKVLTDPVTAAAWLYRADLGDWTAVVDMALTDQCPFPSEFDDFFIITLMKRLAPRYGKVMSNESLELATRALSALKARYRQAGVTTYGAENFPETNQSYLSGRWWW